MGVSLFFKQKEGRMAEKKVDVKKALAVKLEENLNGKYILTDLDKKEILDVLKK